MRFYMTLFAFLNSFIVMAVGIRGIYSAASVHRFGLYVYAIAALILGVGLFVILTVEYVRTWKAKLNRAKVEKDLASAEVK